MRGAVHGGGEISLPFTVRLCIQGESITPIILIIYQHIINPIISIEFLISTQVIVDFSGESYIHFL